MAIRLRDLNPAVFLNKVSIGTTSSPEKLTIAGDSARIKIDDAGGTEGLMLGLLSDGAGFLNLQDTSGATKISLRSDGGESYIRTGTFEHAGLAFSTGTSVDQLTTFTKSMQLDSPTYWFDTGIDDGDLATGVYIFSMHVNDYGVGGTHYDETYSGMMSWFASSTNSSANDEITLHRAGHAPNAGVIQLRTIRSGNGEAHDLKLQIKHNQTCTGSSDYVFKFRRMI